VTSPQAGQLFIVATPIGNLSDLSQRAIETLNEVDLIAAEDTRHSKYLLQHYSISTQTISLHEHNEQQRSELLCKRLLAGESIALISDAGTPLISDPGYRFVTTVRDAGICVVPIPGSCALIAALSASGLASDRFSFEGFLPSKSSARRQVFETLKSDTRTLIFYESPRRLLAALNEAKIIFGDERRACLARELTKLHETIQTSSLAELTDWVSRDENQQRGECVLLIEGTNTEVTADEQEMSRLLGLLLTELPVKKAAAIVASITGGSKNEAYQLALKLQQKD